MESKIIEENGKFLAQTCFNTLQSVFEEMYYLNAVEVKQWLGENIKSNGINQYRNLEWKDYKVTCDILFQCEWYHIGIDFAKQVVYITLGPGNVYSLYYMEPNDQ